VERNRTRKETDKILTQKSDFRPASVRIDPELEPTGAKGRRFDSWESSSGLSQVVASCQQPFDGSSRLPREPDEHFHIDLAISLTVSFFPNNLNPQAELRCSHGEKADFA
jgi:hypothetical protein